MITKAIAARPEPVVAVTPRRVMNGVSAAVQITCNDGKDYIVKGAHLGNVVIAEQIVARLAAALQAPVPDARLVEISQSRKDDNPTLLGHMAVGVAHGLLSVLEDVNEAKEGAIKYPDLKENLQRYARLAVLYGWAEPNDAQFFYNKNPPQLVHSFDHGYFFPGGPNWTIDTIKGGTTTAVAVYNPIKSACNFANGELGEALQLLENVSEGVIAEAVAMPPWRMDMSVRIAFAEYLHTRRDMLLKSLKGV